ncbi:MAG: permease [Candidatus Latescibacteria bacterium]|nr:permease [Candidatus Latescibacterota bacterium]
MDPSSTAISIGRVFLDTSIEIVPLFLLALLIGALIEEFVSERFIARFLTGRHPGTMVLAAIVGALIPLCTCGMVPLAVAIRRRGGDVKHTFGFLTAGAAVSIPVLLLTWKVIGLEWVLARLVASVAFGLLVGYASTVALRRAAARSAEPAPALAAEIPGTIGSRGEEFEVHPIPGRVRSVWRRFLGQTREYAPWVLVSLVLAAVVDVLVPGHWIHVLYGQRTTVGSLLASISGVPFYFCSGAELPLVKELLAKGMGFGPASAMMLAVPIVNIPTFGVVGKWLGPKSALVYLALCVLGATALGVLAGLLLPAGLGV